MKTLSITTLAFIALVFNWFFFWLYAPPSEVQWLCWGMFHSALVGVLIFASRAVWSGDLSALLKTPSSILAGLTVIVTAAMSFGFIVWNPESPMVPLTAYVILFGAAIALYVSWRSIGASIQNSSAADKSGLTFIRQCVLAVEYIIQTEPDLNRLRAVFEAPDAHQATGQSAYDKVCEIKPEMKVKLHQAGCGIVGIHARKVKKVRQNVRGVRIEEEPAYEEEPVDDF